MVARETPKQPTAGAGGKRNVAEILKSVHLFYPLLVTCDLERASAPEGTPDEEKPERFYDSVLQRVEHDGSSELNVAACIFSAGQKIKDVKTLAVDASYFLAFSCEEKLAEGDSKRLLEDLAESSAWQLFRSLFAQIGSQTGEHLPLLPMRPKLRWLQKEETKGQSA